MLKSITTEAVEGIQILVVIAENYKAVVNRWEKDQVGGKKNKLAEKNGTWEGISMPGINDRGEKASCTPSGFH